LGISHIEGPARYTPRDAARAFSNALGTKIGLL
jgi:hypothetical protein